MDSDEDGFDTDDGELDDASSQYHSESNEDDLRGLVGLLNLGNTCYMNGALQALSNCQQLTRFVLDCPGFIKDSGLSRSYSELIKEIWSSRNLQYAVPTSIIRNIKCIYPAFRGCTQQDTQEFLRCFLEQLHDELKQPTIRNGCGSNGSGKKSGSGCGSGDGCSTNSSSPTCEESGDNRAVASTSTNDTNSCNSQRSIITDTFEFKISSSVVCSSCNNISTTKETFKDLSIPIPSRDHPYYQEASNHNDLNNHHQKHNHQQPKKRERSSDCSASSPSTTSDKSVDSPAGEASNDDDSLSESASPNQEHEQEHEHEQEQDLIEQSDTDKISLELSPKSYIDSIPLARWFIDWFSQLGNWFWGPQVTLQDCLSIFFGTDPLEGDNEYSCEVCTKKNRGVKYLKILDLPEVLCIHFKRYESVSSAKITTHVSFPLTGLDLSKFMSESSKPQCTTYNLVACICHHGSALLTGHYTTYALNCHDDQWYEFDDQYVTSVSSYQVENSEAYILFYQKSKPDDTIDRQRVKASKLLKKNLHKENVKKYFISKQWVNKFNTFVEPGPITNYDFLCEHEKVPTPKQPVIGSLCHPISENVWNYLWNLHGGGPACNELAACDICE